MDNTTDIPLRLDSSPCDRIPGRGVPLALPLLIILGCAILFGLTTGRIRFSSGTLFIGPPQTVETAARSVSAGQRTAPDTAWMYERKGSLDRPAYRHAAQ